VDWTFKDIPQNITNQAELLREALKNMYHPSIALAYRAHALRIRLLRVRITTQMKSAYTTPWYDDMPPLSSHPLRRYRHLLDIDWDTSSQESAESINVVPTATPPQRKRQGERNRRTPPLPPNSYGPTQYPTRNRTPVSQRYHYIETRPEVVGDPGNPPPGLANYYEKKNK
jgi:hypothetical protein